MAYKADTSLAPGYFAGQLLIATPLVQDSHFARAVIYVLSHDEEGAMGIVVNHTIQNADCSLIFNHLNIDYSSLKRPLPIHFGGPVESSRGFVLHTRDYSKDTLNIETPIALSSNVEILKDIASGAGPRETIFALGYAGWGAGQLEQEIQENSWIIAPATEKLVFRTQNHDKWLFACKSIGVDISRFSPAAGHA